MVLVVTLRPPGLHFYMNILKMTGLCFELRQHADQLTGFRPPALLLAVESAMMQRNRSSSCYFEPLLYESLNGDRNHKGVKEMFRYCSRRSGTVFTHVLGCHKQQYKHTKQNKNKKEQRRNQGMEEHALGDSNL